MILCWAAEVMSTHFGQKLSYIKAVFFQGCRWLQLNSFAPRSPHPEDDPSTN